MLWTLVCKEPPAPAEGTRDPGHDGGQKAGLSLNWTVPNVVVKDVPDFGQLSPELEAGTAPSLLPFLTCPEDAPHSEDPLSAGRGARGPDPLTRVSVTCRLDWGLGLFSPHFSDEETGAPRGEGAQQGLPGARSPSLCPREPGLCPLSRKRQGAPRALGGARAGGPFSRYPEDGTP